MASNKTIYALCVNKEQATISYTTFLPVISANANRCIALFKYTDLVW